MVASIHEQLEEALKEGAILSPVLSLAKTDKDVVLYFRAHRLDLYCKGNILFQIKFLAGSYYICLPDIKFCSTNKRPFIDHQNIAIDARETIDAFIETWVPRIKFEIARHSTTGREIEFDQAIIRACNFENTNADYLIVDRQVVLHGTSERFDQIGIYWPDHSRTEAFPALIEVKYRQQGGAAEVAKQIKNYCTSIENQPGGCQKFVGDLQELLKRKARLGLFPGLSPDAQRKLANQVEIVSSWDKLKIVVALVDYSPSANDAFFESFREELGHSHDVVILHLGFAMWRERGFEIK